MAQRDAPKRKGPFGLTAPTGWPRGMVSRQECAVRDHGFSEDSSVSVIFNDQNAASFNFLKAGSSLRVA